MGDICGMDCRRVHCNRHLRIASRTSVNRILANGSDNQRRIGRVPMFLIDRIRIHPTQGQLDTWFREG